MMTRVSDAGLVNLKGLTKLHSLDLDATKVTDAGLLHLKGLTKLQSLCLVGTHVTDVGLVHLKGLTQLQSLYLWRTTVTDAGVEALQRALPKCHIRIFPIRQNDFLRGNRLRRFLLWFCWLVLFPLGCGLAVLSFTVEHTMSGRVLGIYFNPFIFLVAIILFALAGWATYRYFKKT